jgi:RNA polymerase sigma factor (TIGR02999 family)
LLYDELRHLARAQLRKRSRRDLVTTELVHEAYLKLFSDGGANAEDRLHFLALAATTMRNILIDHFRAGSAAKRGAGRFVETLDTNSVPLSDKGAVFQAVNGALDRLTLLDPRMGSVVEYKFFGGMTESEIAELLNVSKRTVSEEWRQARAWLSRELQQI